MTDALQAGFMFGIGVMLAALGSGSVWISSLLTGSTVLGYCKDDA